MKSFKTFNKNMLNIVLVLSLLLIFSTRAFSQWTPEQEAKMNAAAKQAEEAAKNLPDNEKKIATFILVRIDKMIRENAKANPNVSKLYSMKGLMVDDAARLQVNVVLFSSSPKSDTSIVAKQVRNLGGSVRLISNPTTAYPIEIYCLVPYDSVKELAKLQQVARISSTGFWVTRTGQVTSIGDSQLKADVARTYFQCDGSGIKAGVISDGIKHAGNSQLSGDLPYLEATHGDTPGDEGTALLEIVYDMAPGASLAFGGIGIGDGPNDMANRIHYLYHNLGCKIVVDDIGWLDGIPIFSQDPVMTQVEYEISNHDKTYVSAAGNHGQSCYDCVSNTDGDGWHLFWKQGSNYFNSNYFTLSAGRTAHILLQWANKWDYANDNYDLYLYDIWGNLKASSTIVQNGQGYNPEERIDYINSEPFDETYYIKIKKVSASENRELKLILAPVQGEPELYLAYAWTNYLGETTPIRQIWGHPAAQGAISVAAYPANIPDQLAAYSSRGPTNFYVFWEQGFTQEQRITPTITATAHVSTKVGYDGNFAEPFDGTSASAPHVAGIAALYFSEHTGDSHTDFYNALTQYATKLGAIGSGGMWNSQSGFGKANAFNTLAKGNYVSVTVSQMDEGLQSFGQIGVYESGSFVNYTVPHTFAWLENSSQTLKSEQNFKPGTTQKYHDWNELSNIVNHHEFISQPSVPELTAYFKNAQNATLQSQLIDGGNPGGTVEFKDPWLIDDNSDPKGPRNRGMNALWYSRPSPFLPGTESNYKGVFLYQDPAIFANYYYVRVPQVQIINGFSCYFLDWITNSANLTQPNNLVGSYYESPVIFQGANATVTAKYKAYMGSSAAEAIASNNGRRLIRDSNGAYHFVYQSVGEIYYQYSTDSGASWLGGIRLSSGNGGSKYPAIVKNTTKTYVIWQRNTGSNNYTIYFCCNLGSGWSTPASLGNITCSSPNNPLPVLTVKEVRVSGGARKIRLVAAWKANSGIYHRYSDNDGSNWSTTTLLPGTMTSHKNLSLSPGAMFDNSFLDIYGTYDNGSTISLNSYHTNLANNSTAWGAAEIVPGSSGTYARSSQATSDDIPNAHIVWQGIDPITDYEAVYYQRKSVIAGNWSAVQAFVGEFYQYPTITNLLSRNLALIWDLAGCYIYKATYSQSTGSWSSAQRIGSGFNPNLSISFGNANPASAAKYIWSYGYSSPYQINISLEMLQKEVPIETQYHRRVVVADTTNAIFLIDMSKICLHTKNKAITPYEFVDVNDTLLTLTENTLWEPLHTKSIYINEEADSLVAEIGIFCTNIKQLLNPQSKAILVKFELVDAFTEQFIGLIGNELGLSASGKSVFQIKSKVTGYLNKAILVRPVVQGLSRDRKDLLYSLVHVHYGQDLQKVIEQGEAGMTIANLPHIYSLKQNYPNPFNFSTKIIYTLPEVSQVTLKIFNLNGELVRTLVDYKQEANEYQIIWNGNDDSGLQVASGIYFYQLEAGTFRQIRPMVLVR